MIMALSCSGTGFAIALEADFQELMVLVTGICRLASIPSARLPRGVLDYHSAHDGLNGGLAFLKWRQTAQGRHCTGVGKDAVDARWGIYLSRQDYRGFFNQAFFDRPIVAAFG
jgi:hypothetical protein